MPRRSGAPAIFPTGRTGQGDLFLSWRSSWYSWGWSRVLSTQVSLELIHNSGALCPQAQGFLSSTGRYLLLFCYLLLRFYYTFVILITLLLFLPLGISNTDYLSISVSTPVACVRPKLGLLLSWKRIWQCRCGWREPVLSPGVCPWCGFVPELSVQIPLEDRNGIRPRTETIAEKMPFDGTFETP